MTLIFALGLHWNPKGSGKLLRYNLMMNVLNFLPTRFNRLALCASAPSHLSSTQPSCGVAHDNAADSDGVALLEREPEKLKPPPRYAVLLLNDDYTPMEFVVAILRQVFNRSEDESVAIMLKVHNDGRGVCGVYTRDLAETRVAQVADLAKKFGHPLQCVAEPVDEE